MSKHMHVAYSAFVITLACTTAACVDVSGDDTPDTAIAEQAISHNEVRLRRIKPVILEEGGDEIYLTASQSQGGSVNVIRPSTVPDYWRFDDTHTEVMNQHVGTIVSGLLIVNLWEQDGGPHFEIGTIDFGLDNAGEPRTYDTPTGEFVRIDDGFFLVRFTRGARYYVWFEVGP